MSAYSWLFGSSPERQALELLDRMGPEEVRLSLPRGAVLAIDAVLLEHVIPERYRHGVTSELFPEPLQDIEAEVLRNEIWDQWTAQAESGRSAGEVHGANRRASYVGLYHHSPKVIDLDLTGAEIAWLLIDMHRFSQRTPVLTFAPLDEKISIAQLAAEIRKQWLSGQSNARDPYRLKNRLSDKNSARDPYRLKNRLLRE